MKNVTKLKYAEFDQLYNYRKYNPDAIDPNLIEVLYDGIYSELVQIFNLFGIESIEDGNDEGWLIHDSPSGGCFTDIVFESDAYLSEELIAKIQDMLKSQDVSWMVCISFLDFHFITASNFYEYSKG